ncbi:MAG: hypothetical protein QM725_11010 [Lacibacter sp.]
MKKAIVAASFLSDVTKNNNAVLENENCMYVIREEGSMNHASKLYYMFFGSTVNNTSKKTEDQSFSEPDYYSSYE